MSPMVCKCVVDDVQKAKAFGARSMNTPQNGKKRSQTENRYNFEPPTFDSSQQDWQIADPNSSAAAHVPEHQAQPRNEDLHWHQPAPMQKRADAPKQNRNRKPSSGEWSTFTIVTLIGLASFIFVVDLAGGGKLRSLITPNLAPTVSIENNELAAPAPSTIVELPEPAEPIVPAAPPMVKAEPDLSQVAQTPVPQEQPVVVQNPIPEVIAPALPVFEVKPEPQAKVEPIVAQILQGQIVRDCADCPELVAVSAGNIATENASTLIEPFKNVTIGHDFAIGRNAITFQDWEKCVSDGVCSPITEDAGWGRGTRPLIFVSYDMVTSQYLPWLSKLTGNVYRLPSKEEWQYAAMGGEGGTAKTNQFQNTSQDCFNASGPLAENCSDTFDGTSPVGSFAPNRLGLSDMQGNVWSWSVDCWQPFTKAPSAKSDACAMRVLLGGAWSTNRSAVTATFSGWEKSSKRANSIGFRVVRNLP